MYTQRKFGCYFYSLWFIKDEMRKQKQKKYKNDIRGITKFFHGCVAMSCLFLVYLQTIEIRSFRRHLIVIAIAFRFYFLVVIFRFLEILLRNSSYSFILLLLLLSFIFAQTKENEKKLNWNENSLCSFRLFSFWLWW